MAAIAALDAPVAITSATAARPAEPLEGVAFDSLLTQAVPVVAVASPALPAAPAPELAKPVLKPAAGKPVSASESLADALPLASFTPSTEVAVLLTRASQARDLPPKDATEPVVLSNSPEAFLRWMEAVKEIAEPVPPSPALPATTVALPVSTVVDTAVALPTDAATALAPIATDTAAAPVGTSTPAFAVAPNAAPLPPAPPAVASPLPLSNTPLLMDQPEWPQRLGEQIQWHLGVGIQEARIEINPRELGAVDVRLSVDDNGLRVHLTAAHAQTREMLQSELPRLRETLQQGGVLLADAQVGQEAPGRDSARQDRSDFSAGQGEALSDSTAPALPTAWRHRRGLLDDYA